MRLVIHDFGAYPFPVQLSRELASRGHSVQHWHCSSAPPAKGVLAASPGDPELLTVRGIALGSPFSRYALSKRLQQEVSYGRRLSGLLNEVRPDAFITANTPLISLFIISSACSRSAIPLYFWQQDVISQAIRATLRRRLSFVGVPVAMIADWMERLVSRRAQAIIPISDGFLHTLALWGVAHKAHVIPNWAPLSDVPVRPRDNIWAREHDLVGRPVVLYAGTLGLKHNPAILLDVAIAMRRTESNGRVVVVSEGLGRDWLAKEAIRRRLDNILLLDYQPYKSLPDVLGSADVLVAILEPSAGQYSVPSKIMSYLCSGRAIVAAVPQDNPAAQELRLSGGGVQVDPRDSPACTVAILDLLADQSERDRLASAGRQYAVRAYDMGRIADGFEALLVSNTKLSAL